MKGYLYPHVHCSIIYNSQDMETTKVSISGWVDKGNVESKLDIGIYTMEYYSAVKKKDFLLFVITWMKLEGTNQSEISQTEKENMVWSHLCVGSSMILVEAEKRLVVARGEVW